MKMLQEPAFVVYMFIVFISISIMLSRMLSRVFNDQLNANTINAPIIILSNTHIDLESTRSPHTNHNHNTSQHRQHITSALNQSSMSFYLNKSVIFLGMVHNAQNTLPYILEQINQVTCVFNNSFFLIFESNSEDNTSAILHNWSVNTTLQSNHGQRMDYCYHLDNTSTHYPNIINKKIISGDALVQSHFDEYVASKSNKTYTYNLSRIEQFVPYRNMLLEQLYKMNTLRTHIDYIFMIDLDVWEIDFHAFLLELQECPHDIMCSNGVESYGRYRDSFASVEMNHNWIFRPYVLTKSNKIYNKKTDELRQVMPRTGHRYEQMRSCFGGLSAYKLTPKRMQDIGCKYLLNHDVKSKVRVNNDRDHKWLYEVNRLIQWSNSKGIMYDTTSGYERNLCEHISFHYCLNYRAGITMSIARDAKLYYFELNDVLINPDDNPRRKRRRDRLRKIRFDPLPVSSLFYDCNVCRSSGTMEISV